ncbi:MAG: DUF4292 domain-containing protein [Ignavibacteriales bacterium]|nr:DUF4292 domain-containing protein [Ignavibacteriales bacterium]
MKIIILSGFLLFLAGCASGMRADRTLTPERIGEAVVANHNRVASLFGTGTISVETPEIAQSVSFELALRKPDSIMVRIEGPFGLGLGLALLTRDEFLFYNSMQNRVLVGPSTPENLSRFFRVRLDFDDLLNMLSGGVFPDEDRGEPDAFDIEANEYVFTYRHTEGTRRYWVEPESFQIVRINHLDSRGTVVLEQTFGRFVRKGEVTLPQLVRVVMRQERRRVSIAYADLSLNPSILRFRFDIPADAKRALVQ